MKRFLSLFILVVFLSSAPIRVLAQDENNSSAVFHGHAEKTDKIDRDNKKIFTGDVEDFGQERKDFINMTVSQVLSSGYTESGDEFFAEVTNDVLGDKGIILPVGTIAHGKVREIQDGKRFGRKGWIELTFDSLITPDGREIPIEGRVSTKSNVATSVAKGVGGSTLHTVGGGVVGGLVALNLLGLEAAIASQGYTVLGGAAIGGVVGLGVFLLKKGDGVMLSPGDEIKVRLTTKVTLPVMTNDAFKQDDLKYDGLDIKIVKLALQEDPFGEDNTYVLDLDIDNETDKDFSSMDIAMISETNKKYYPSVFVENTLMFKTIKAHDRVHGKMAFAVDNPNKKHWLVFYDRQTRKPLSKISIDNIKRQMALDKQNRKKKRKQK